VQTRIEVLLRVETFGDLKITVSDGDPDFSQVLDAAFERLFGFPVLFILVNLMKLISTQDVRSERCHCAAALGGNAEVASLLIGAGADINARDKDGKTALISAVVCGYESLVELLLDNNADASIKNEVSLTNTDRR